MRAFPAVAVWLVLLVLLLGEVLAARLPVLRGAVPAMGIAMALLVALTFMRLGVSRGLTPVFAVAGVFWLCVMLGLGCLDSFSRHDVAVSMATGAADSR